MGQGRGSCAVAEILTLILLLIESRMFTRNVFNFAL